MVSMNETLDNEQKKDFIGSIVNEMGIVKIDVYTILLDFDAELVYATRYGSIQDLMLAKSGQTVDGVFSFTMNENDVISELEELKTRGVFCSDRWAVKQTGWSQNLQTNVLNPGNATCPIQAGVEYKKYGVYFQLSAESYVTNWATLLGTSTVVSRKLAWTGNWTRRCGTSSSFSGSSTSTQTWHAVCNRYRVIVYGNVRALKSYSIRATITSPNSVPANDSKAITISN